MDFMSYWQYSDMVTKALFFILIALSIISWVTGILRVLQSRKLAVTVSDDLNQQISAIRPDTAVAVDSSTRRLITEQALLKHIGRYRFASERGLPVLGTTAAIAPFIGLFGTVWGIFHALHNIGTTGQAGLGQVAAPVGEALIMTGLGIAVAIPAVVFYNLAVRINRRVMFHANDRAHDLLAQSTVPADAITHNTATSDSNTTSQRLEDSAATTTNSKSSAPKLTDDKQSDGYYNSATSRS